MRAFGILISVLFSVGADVLVTIPNGSLRGRIEYYPDANVSFYAFQQIPFAKPPVGELRFKAPEPVEKWDGILDATKDTKVCFQASTFDSDTEIETEDCLYLNVYTPVDPALNGSLPVIYYIYGGGFVSGYGTFEHYGPHWFMNKGVIMVTINYRIGPFGFLATGDTVIPGNSGLKDQNLGLQWVRDNIKYFGGDPNQVTLLGVSAGGASVTYQMMSKKSEGLFRAGIAESGTLLCPWAYQREYKQYAYATARNIDSNFNMNATSTELLQFLQSVTAEQVRHGGFYFPSIVGNEQLVQGFWWTPVIEPEHPDAFLTENMYEAVANGRMTRVPLLAGICSEEMISFKSNVTELKSSMQEYEKDLATLVNKNMHITDHTELVQVGDEIRKIYTNGQFQDNLGDAVRYFSDTAFTRAIIRTAQLQSQFSDVYFYQFSYSGVNKGNKVVIPGAGIVGHGEDSQYLWVWHNYSSWQGQPAADKLTSDRVLALYTNFAKYLNPTPEASPLLQNVIWPKVQSTNFRYLNLNESLTIETDPKADVFQKWVDLYERRGIKPFDSY